MVLNIGIVSVLVLLVAGSSIRINNAGRFSLL